MSHTKEAHVLVLTRKTNQDILIGKDIVITICAIRGDRIRIGIQAPSDVPITRKELLPVKESREEQTRR
jgi:carbon storage regulator